MKMPDTKEHQSARDVGGSVPVTPEDIETVKTDPRFDLPTRKVATAEDAIQAYLRGEISEGELRTVCAAYGYVIPTMAGPLLETLDNSFEKKIPDDLLLPAATLAPLEDRLKKVEERDKNAEKAEKASEDAKVDPALDPTVRGNIENKAAAKALEKENHSQNVPKSDASTK
jgi:hypothetical protein